MKCNIALFRRGYHPANKGIKGGPKDSLKPPDLWIHDMEMKSMKGQGDGSMSGMTSIPHHGSQDIKDVDDSHPGTHTLDRRRSSFNSKCAVLVWQT